MTNRAAAPLLREHSRIKRPRPFTRGQLEAIYRRYNRRACVGLDPVGFLYRYQALRDREIVALIASSLAYGRVAQIARSVSWVLERLPAPYADCVAASPRTLVLRMRGFTHRFTTGFEVAALLAGISRVLARHGSLERCLASHMKDNDETIMPAITGLVHELGNGQESSLLPSPCRGSACKRLNLFLRWMVRRDAVDPGGWRAVPPSKLVVPLDTHMYRICAALRLTRRRQADLRAAIEVTGAFRKIAPDDPVRYDFALTRMGMAGIIPSG
ncbi:MAG: TIGR02757 family protein [Candidatus Aureabacteria bacterium]|nr:TIGR02757 family protein [Candidatus Auribacterota bacterium]